MNRPFRTIITFSLIIGCGLSSCRHSLTPEEARTEIGRLNLPYSEAGLVDACKNGDIIGARLFLLSGMKPDVYDSLGRPLHSLTEMQPSASIAISLKVKEDLLTRGYGKPQAPAGATPLMAAAANNRLDVLKLLLSKGADPNLPDRYGFTALSYTAWKGNIQCAQALLRAGADIKGGPGSNDSFLFIACEHNQPEMVTLLLDSGADIEQNAQYFGTPLIDTCSHGFPDVVKLLLDRGANPNAQDSSRRTPLITAVCANSLAELRRPDYLESARLLIDHNADLKIRDSQNRTALSYCANSAFYKAQNGEMEHLLRTAGAH